MTVSGVRSDHIGTVWAQMWPLIEPAYRMSPEKGDILGGILARDLQIWAVWEKMVLVAGIVTRLRAVGTSGHLDCRIWLVGGARLSSWAPDFMSTLIPWAKAEGCASISGAGRKGWSRIVARFGGERIPDENGLPAWRLAL